MTINVAGGKGKGRRYAGDPGEATIDLGKDKELNDGVETQPRPSRDSGQQVESTDDDNDISALTGNSRVSVNLNTISQKELLKLSRKLEAQLAIGEQEDGSEPSSMPSDSKESEPEGNSEDNNKDVSSSFSSEMKVSVRSPSSDTSE